MKNKKVLYGVLGALAVIGAYMYYKRKRVSAPAVETKDTTSPGAPKKDKATSAAIKEQAMESATLLQTVKDKGSVEGVMTK